MYNSAEGMMVEFEMVLKLLDEHGVEVEEFLEEFGKKEEYKAQEVLVWLGY